MNRPQTNFLPVTADHQQPIDLRGDTRTGDERLADALRFGDPVEAYDDADDGTGPVSPPILQASWRTGQAHVDAIGSGTYAEFLKKRQAHQRLQADIAADLRRGLEHLRGQFPHHDPPNEPATRYVEGLAHTEAAPVPAGHAERPFGGPAAVPDGYGPRPPRVPPQEPPPSVEERAREAMSSAGVLVIGFIGFVLAGAVIVAWWWFAAGGVR